MTKLSVTNNYIHFQFKLKVGPANIWYYEVFAFMRYLTRLQGVNLGVVSCICAPNQCCPYHLPFNLSDNKHNCQFVCDYFYFFILVIKLQDKCEN